MPLSLLVNNNKIFNCNWLSLWILSSTASIKKDNFYSYRKASSADILVARCAGYIPVVIPTIRDKKAIRRTNDTGTVDTSRNPTPLKIAKAERTKDSSCPAKAPKTNPPMPPKNPMIIDSVKNKSCTSVDFMPIAFIMPISWVRSKSEMVRVLNMPSAATPQKRKIRRIGNTGKLG